MSTGLPKRFDPHRLAAQGGGPESTLAGELDTGMMPRLVTLLATAEPVPVRFRLEARRDEARRLLLQGHVEADLACTCQRCMEPVTLPVRADFTLAVVSDADEARQLPAELDPLLLEAGAEADLPALLEDELMLALPAVPMHEDAAACGERARYLRAADDDEAFDGDAGRENPFAVLKKLKDRNTD